jgi:phenylpyruvate tautomerase
MPLLQIQTSSAAAPPPGWLSGLSAEVARALGKPEAYVMVTLTRTPDMLFAGSAEASCFAALKSIGTLSPEATEKLSALLCARFTEGLDVPRARIYIEFVDAKPHLWGYDGGTFA